MDGFGVASKGCVCIAYVIPKLNRTDRCFFANVNSESQGVFAYAGVNVSGLGVVVNECSSISTLEWVWNNIAWGEKSKSESVIDQAWFCMEVAQRTNSSSSSGREK